MKQSIEIDGRKIGPQYKPYTIAEISCNHSGDIEKAFRIMEAMAETGVDAVKLQTYEAKTITLDGPQDFYRLDHKLWNGLTYHELYSQAQTPFEWMEKLFKKGKELGITVFSTPFDETAADLLIELDAPAYKIASFENGHLPLIEKVARTGKPVIISTGMLDAEGIELAVRTAREAGCVDLVLLHCVSSYPCNIQDLNLATIPDMIEKFGVMVGLSNHYVGPSPLEPDLEPALAAFKLGAVMLEMHVMENENDRTFDESFSMLPSGFRLLIEEISQLADKPFTEKMKLAIGKPCYTLKQAEESAFKIRPAIKAAVKIKAGEYFSTENIVVRRPNVGLAPSHWHNLLGKKAACDIDFADGITAAMVRDL